LAATNRPQDLDEAALRRFTKRIFMPLPDAPAREALIECKIKQVRVELSETDKAILIQMTERYSFADLNGVIKEAAMCSVRELTSE
jgi:spastin